MTSQGCFTTVANNTYLDWWLGAKPYAPPSLWYVGLSRLYADGAGKIREPLSTYYRRQPVKRWETRESSHHNPCARVNAEVISWGVPPDPSNWTPLLSLFLTDRPTGGVAWFVANLTREMVVMPNEPIRMAPGALWITTT